MSVGVTNRFAESFPSFLFSLPVVLIIIVLVIVAGPA